jgi:hypothetical protein
MLYDRRSIFIMLPAIGLIITFIIMIIVLTWRIISSGEESLGEWTGGADKYQRGVLSKWKHLRKPKVRMSYSDFCHNTGKYKVQPQQKLIGEYMRPAGHVDSMLIVHKIGAGKTCLSIQVGLKWRGREATRVSGEPTPARPLFVMPASLIPGFRAELRSPCAGDDYLTVQERVRLATVEPGSAEYSDIISRSDKRIDRDFNIMSYNKFASAEKRKVAAPILIVDEVQNINSGGTYYSAVKKWTETYTGPIMLMSATPLFDRADEIRGLAVLMRLDPPPVITPADIPSLFGGKISFFSGADPIAFPEVAVKVKKCVMSQHQAKWYRAQVEAEMKKSGDVKLREIAESFYIKSRQKSNIVYPKGVSGQAGLDLLSENMIRSNLGTYSTKYAALVRRLLRSYGPEGLSFVYTGFTGAGGIRALTKILGAVGYKDYFADGPGKRRYAAWSGEETMREKQMIRDVFNSRENDDGSQIQVVIGSSAIKEGVSLMRVRTVHIMELYWNHSHLDQIMGRAIRYCSHKTLPARDRTVMVYIYAAVVDGVSSPPKPEESIDLYMLNIADQKRDEIAPYMAAIEETAVDKLVHYP